VLPGEVPSPINPPAGCHFHPRCPLATEECRRVVPLLRAAPNSPAGHNVACHHAEQITPTTLQEKMQSRV